MSEVDIDVTGEPPAQLAGRADVGSRLAAARERRGWSINEVASRVRLSPKQVSALERMALAELPGPVFVRGFLRTYAREVGLDPAPLLDDYNALVGGEPVPAATAPSHASSPVFRAAAREHYARPVVLGAAIVLLVALGVIGAVTLRKPAAPAPAVSTAPVPPTSRATAPAPAASPTADAVKAATGSDSAQEPPPANVSAPIAAAAEPGAAPTVTVPAAATAPAAESAIRLTFAEVSWVEVLDASGKQLLSQNNPAGSEVRLDGRPPFQVLIGNASGTRLEYRGKPVELGPMTSRDNVARVKLN
jgi:cytoskeleton protein RodZ